VGDSWRADETYIKVRGQWVYLYRAVDKQGQTVDFLLSKRRDMAAATPKRPRSSSARWSVHLIRTSSGLSAVKFVRR
jgi:transposase-like protein